MPKSITIYTTNTCAYCVMVKKFLTAKRIKYNEVNVDKHPERRQEAIDASGAMTVPVTILTQQDDTKTVVVGFNLNQLIPALKLI